MATYTTMLRHISADTFGSLMHDAGRKAREAVFARHGVRAPKSPKTSISLGSKHEARSAKLFEVLQHIDDEALCEELLRQLFLRHRTMLARALDEMGVPHEDGLTNADELSRFADMDDAAAQTLIATLVQSGVDGHEIAHLYVDFMRAQMRQAREEKAE